MIGRRGLGVAAAAAAAAASAVHGLVRRTLNYPGGSVGQVGGLTLRGRTAAVNDGVGFRCMTFSRIAALSTRPSWRGSVLFMFIH
jgi:hypothetical protein